MIDPPEEAYTKTLVTLCDDTIDVKARLDSREEMDALFERLAHVADFLWPVDDAGEEEAQQADVSHETHGAHDEAPQVTSFEFPLVADDDVVTDAARMVSKADAARGPIRDCLKEEERALVSFGERQLLGPRQIEAVALKRAGLSHEASAQRMGLASASNVSYHLRLAREKGVNP